MRKNVEGLFQFTFEQTSLGKFMLHSVTEKPASAPRHDDEDLDVDVSDEEEGDDVESGDDSEDEPSDKKKRKPSSAASGEERSKRSIKRQRQNEKKRLAAAATPEEVIERAQKKMDKIDMKSEVVRFAVSDDEEEEE